RIDVGVEYDTEDLGTVKSLLEEAANTHAHILGDWDVKSGLLEKRLAELPESYERRLLQAEYERLEIENEIRNECESLIRTLTATERAVKVGGLQKNERVELSKVLKSICHPLSEMRRNLTVWVHLLAQLDAAYNWKKELPLIGVSEMRDQLPSIEKLDQWRIEKTCDDVIEEEIRENEWLVVLGIMSDASKEFYLAADPTWLKLSEELAENHKSVLDKIHGVVDQWQESQPAWSLFRDFYTLYETWHKPVRDLFHRLDGCGNPEDLHGAKEFTLDNRIEKVVNLLENKFLLRPAGWQCPDAEFVGFGASSLDFRLEFFVDDLVREHFGRLDSTYSDIGLDILERFNKHGIEIPFPQQDIHFSDQWMKNLLSEADRNA
ncbi:hypothetical protein ACFLSZ_02650, partial [Candidatus Bipolaricaulota bacterium]